MPFNASKCKHVQIGKTDARLLTYIDNAQIPLDQTLKYLWVHFENNLKWSSHIAKISKKANKTLGMLRRCLKGAPEKLKLIAYITQWYAPSRNTLPKYGHHTEKY